MKIESKENHKTVIPWEYSNGAYTTSDQQLSKGL